MMNDWSVPATNWQDVIERYVAYRQVVAWRARVRDKHGNVVSQCDSSLEAEKRQRGLERAVALIRKSAPEALCHPLPADVPAMLSALRVGGSRADRATSNDIKHLWRALLFNRAGYACQYCHRTAWDVFAASARGRTLRFEVDHRTPRTDNSREFDPDNSATACLSCNRMKAQLTEEQFLEELKSLAASVCGAIGSVVTGSPLTGDG